MMSPFELEVRANEAGRQEKPKLSVFDYVTMLFLPVLSLLAMILKNDIQPPMFWSLLAFMVVSFAAGFYHPITAWVRLWRERREDRRVARKAFPELRRFVHRFEEFIRNEGSTLHYIAQCDVCDGDGLRYQALRLPELSLCPAFWKNFANSLDPVDMKPAGFS